MDDRLGQDGRRVEASRPEGRRTVRIAAMADIHCGKASQGVFQWLFTHIAEHADILVLAGDLTDYGSAEEARVLAREITTSGRLPIVGVLGNHDYEANEADEVTKILTDAGVHMLDGEVFESHGIGFAGVKGFAGGFGRGVLGAWGELAVKAFVQEAIDESLKLESALARLRTPNRIAVLHYSPIRATVEGEPLEIFPYLGCSRLEEPLLRYPVSAVFHGHAHRGCAEGATASGVPVYNVAVPLLRANAPDDPPYKLIEIDPDVPMEPRRDRRRGDHDAEGGHAGGAAARHPAAPGGVATVPDER
jgi:Icc-related predicted phosphoesterase